MQLTKNQIEILRKHWPKLDGFQFHRRVANFVFFATLDRREVVLRLTEPVHREKAEIESELDWMNFLSIKGMKLAKPIKTVDGSFVAEIFDEKKYYAVIFEKAQGVHLSDEDVPSEELILNWGSYLGKMHQLTKLYQVPSQIKVRQPWHLDESLAMALRSLDKSDLLPFQRLNELMEWMRSLPQDSNCYGLVHCDLHRGNFHIEANQLMAFDFDDSCYQWFSYDIVAPINSIHKNLFEGVTSLTKEKALETFLKGYQQENFLDKVWIQRIEMFDKYRAALVYHWAKTCIKENIFDSTGLEWARVKLPKFLDTFKEPLKLF